MNRHTCRVCGEKAVRSAEPTLVSIEGYVIAYWYCRHCGAEYTQEMGQASYEKAEISETVEAE